MGDDPDQSDDISQGVERLLTLLGLLSLVILIAMGCMHDLVVRLFSIHPTVSICLVFTGVGMAFMAIYGLGNAWRLLRRGSRRQNPNSIDLGWGGAMGHYTEADEDPFGMPPVGG